MKVSELYKEFTESEKSGGILLIICTLISLVITNSGYGTSYPAFWHHASGEWSPEYIINDGLMTIFFLLIGLELEREIYIGELSKIRNALFPIAAALGGMILPAAIYSYFNAGTPTQAGAGIPMATDIAFALGILSLLGKKVPVSLKIFLTALAVIDDLGAILVIAVFYTGQLDWTNLSIALGIFLLLLVMNRMKIRNLIPYLIGGVVMWYYMLHSGIHATITGVMLAFAIPFGNGDKKSTSYLLQRFLHKPVAFLILPLFALANTAILINTDFQKLLEEPVGIGILAGLTLGKPIGILLFCFLAVKSGLCKLPAGLRWTHITGAGLLAGIGFTMSIFITLLAFDNAFVINNAKFIILISAAISGVAGFVWLKVTLKKKAKPTLSTTSNT